MPPSRKVQLTKKPDHSQPTANAGWRQGGGEPSIASCIYAGRLETPFADSAQPRRHQCCRRLSQ
jgi:hypothetical protein